MSVARWMIRRRPSWTRQPMLCKPSHQNQNEMDDLLAGL